MNNNPNVPNDSIQMELQSKVDERREYAAAFPRTTMAGMLMAAAIAALAVTSLIQTDQQAAANSSGPVARAPALASIPLSVPPDSGQVQFFGYLEFEYLAGGLPGFGALPSTSRAQ
jgi:hypothetical protein